MERAPMIQSVEDLPQEQRTARYREMVAEVLRLANDAQDPEVRAQLRELAAVWATLAVKAEPESEESRSTAVADIPPDKRPDRLDEC